MFLAAGRIETPDRVLLTRDPSASYTRAVDEPRTHYQLSFTGRQALLLFVALIAALGVAFAFGLLTGVTGRSAAPMPAPAEGSPSESAATPATAGEPTPSLSRMRGETSPLPSPSPSTDSLELPRPVRGVPPPASGRSAASATRIAPVPPSHSAPSSSASLPPGPTPSPGLELFEDEGGVAPTPAASIGAVPGASSGAGRRARAETATKNRPASRAADASAFWVQALSATSENESRAQRDRLVRHGYPVTIVPGSGPGGKKVFRVRVGPYRNREDADRAAAKIKAREKLQPWVVPPGK